MADTDQQDTEALPDPGASVRRLVRAAGQAALATTLARDGSGRPYVSLVLVACDHDASPVLLISELADHTRNLTGDRRAALLFDGTAGYQDPLTGPRASLQGELHPVADPDLAACLKQRFAARHPGAEIYIDFKDFQVHRMTVASAHLVAGFGRIHWLDPAAILFDAADCAELAEAEPSIVEHMNQDHAEALRLIGAQVRGHAPAVGSNTDDWVMTGIDPEGIDLRAGPRLIRAAFEAPIRDTAGARAALVAMTRAARSGSI